MNFVPKSSVGLAMVLAAASAGAQCAGKIAIQNVVSTNMGNGYHSSTLQLQNTTDKSLSGTLQFSAFPTGFTLKAGGTRPFKMEPHGLYSIYFAVSQRAMNKGDVNLVYDSASLPAKGIYAKLSACTQ